MTSLRILLQTACVALPLSAGLALWLFGKNRRRCETLSIAVSVGTFCLLWITSASSSAPLDSDALRELSAGRPLGSLLSLLIAGITACFCIGQKRDSLPPQARGALLATEALLILFYTVPSHGIAAAACLLSPIPLAVDLLRATRMEGRARPVTALAVAFTGSALVGAALLGQDKLLLLAGVFLGTAILPCFGWQLYLAARTSLPLYTLWIVGQPALYALASFGPEAAGAPEWLVSGLQVLALLTALAGSILGAVTQDLRRQIGCVGLTMGGILLATLLLGSNLVNLAAALAWCSLSLCIAGLALIGSAIESRIQHVETRWLGHVAIDAPVLGGFGIAFALALVGLPGTLGFVADELMLDGWVESSHPLGAAALALAVALTAINLMRVFLGILPSARPERLPLDLTTRERAASLLALLPLIAFGLAPRPLIGQLTTPGAANASSDTSSLYEPVPPSSTARLLADTLGSLSTNSAPPGELARIEPPCALATACAMASPSPDPGAPSRSE